MRALSELVINWRVSSGALLAWWLHELRDIAETMLARIAPRFVTRTLVRVGSTQAEISIVRGKRVEPLLSVSCDADGQWPIELPGPDASIRGTRAVLALAPEHVLSRRLTLPEGVERDLERVITLQLERESPIPPERVCVEHLITERLKQDRRIGVEVLIVHRERLEKLRDLVRAWGLRPMRIGVERSGQVIGNFLGNKAASQAMRATRIDRRLAAAGGALAVSCALVIGWQWGYERLEVGRELRKVAVHAANADKLFRQLASAASPGEALVRTMEQPDALDMLTALTNQVPADSWVYDLEITAEPASGGPQIRLSGFTPAATLLVDQLGKSGQLTNVRLVSASSAGLGSGQDRLQLTASWLDVAHAQRQVLTP
jgi:hypothetical protein